MRDHYVFIYYDDVKKSVKYIVFGVANHMDNMKLRTSTLDGLAEFKIGPMTRPDAVGAYTDLAYIHIGTLGLLV